MTWICLYCFNRKEAKPTVKGQPGRQSQGRVMLVDDVITAGTAIRESMEIIRAHGAELAGVLISGPSGTRSRRNLGDSGGRA